MLRRSTAVVLFTVAALVALAVTPVAVLAQEDGLPDELSELCIEAAELVTRFVEDQLDDDTVAAAAEFLALLCDDGLDALGDELPDLEGLRDGLGGLGNELPDLGGLFDGLGSDGGGALGELRDRLGVDSVDLSGSVVLAPFSGAPLTKCLLVELEAGADAYEAALVCVPPEFVPIVEAGREELEGVRLAGAGGVFGEGDVLGSLEELLPFLLEGLEGSEGEGFSFGEGEGLGSLEELLPFLLEGLEGFEGEGFSFGEGEGLGSLEELLPFLLEGLEGSEGEGFSFGEGEGLGSLEELLPFLLEGLEGFEGEGFSFGEGDGLGSLEELLPFLLEGLEGFEGEGFSFGEGEGLGDLEGLLDELFSELAPEA